MTKQHSSTGSTRSTSASAGVSVQASTATEPARPLRDVVAEVRARTSDAFSPVYVVCGPAARNDVVTALAQEGACMGVSVQTLPMFLNSVAKRLAPRERLPRPVIRRCVAEILGSEETEFSRAGLAGEPVTLRSLTSIVTRLLDIPAEQACQHGGLRLPRACSEIAERVRRCTADDYFTGADVLAWRAILWRTTRSSRWVCSISVLASQPFSRAL
nr:hypothetical protein [Corynebacterium lactis]